MTFEQFQATRTVCDDLATALQESRCKVEAQLADLGVRLDRIETMLADIARKLDA